MAIVSCHECNGKVSTEADRCPHCGAPVKPPPAAKWESLAEQRPPSPGAQGAAPASPTPETGGEQLPLRRRGLFRRMFRRRYSAKPAPLIDKYITPGRTLQHTTAGGFGWMFGSTLGVCAAIVLMILLLIVLLFVVYALTSQHYNPPKTYH